MKIVSMATSLVVLTVGVLTGSGSATASLATPVYPDQVIKSYAGLPEGWSFEFVQHPNSGSRAYGTFRHVTTDVPLDVGALRLSAGPRSSIRLHIPVKLSGLNAMVFEFGSTQAPQAPGWMRVYATVDGNSYWAPLAADAPSFEATTLPLTPTGAQEATTSLEALSRVHHGPAELTFVISNKATTAGAYADLDWWVANQTPTSQSIDFEGPHLAMQCFGGNQPQIILAGDSVQHTAFFANPTRRPVADAKVALWSLPTGHPISRPVATRSSGPRGRVEASTRPLRRTRYFWQHDQDPRFGRCRTSVTQVLVRRALTVNAAGRIRTQAPWRVTGTIFPLSAGRTVDLWQRTPRGERLVATTTVAPDGTFGFTRQMTDGGRHQFLVRGAEDFGNLPGRSRVISVWVR
jgi:hypothetical protein